MTWKVTKVYQRSRENPVSGKAGDVLETGKTDDWDGNGNIWLWCKDKEGREGWIAEEVLELDGERAILKTDFNALELSVQTGETLEGTEKLAAWLLSKNQQGQTGWLPLANVEELL